MCNYHGFPCTYYTRKVSKSVDFVDDFGCSGDTNYIVRNGMMKDLSVLQESPFTDQGSISELFEDVSMFMTLRAVIESINRNAVAA